MKKGGMWLGVDVKKTALNGYELALSFTMWDNIGACFKGSIENEQKKLPDMCSSKKSKPHNSLVDCPWKGNQRKVCGVMSK